MQYHNVLLWVAVAQCSLLGAPDTREWSSCCKTDFQIQFLEISHPDLPEDQSVNNPEESDNLVISHNVKSDNPLITQSHGTTNHDEEGSLYETSEEASNEQKKINMDTFESLLSQVRTRQQIKTSPERRRRRRIKLRVPGQRQGIAEGRNHVAKEHRKRLEPVYSSFASQKRRKVQLVGLRRGDVKGEISDYGKPIPERRLIVTTPSVTKRPVSRGRKRVSILRSFRRKEEEKNSREYNSDKMHDDVDFRRKTVFRTGTEDQDENEMMYPVIEASSSTSKIDDLPGPGTIPPLYKFSIFSNRTKSEQLRIQPASSGRRMGGGHSNFPPIFLSQPNEGYSSENMVTTTTTERIWPQIISTTFAPEISLPSNFEINPSWLSSNWTYEILSSTASQKVEIPTTFPSVTTTEMTTTTKATTTVPIATTTTGEMYTRISQSKSHSISTSVGVILSVLMKDKKEYKEREGKTEGNEGVDLDTSQSMSLLHLHTLPYSSGVEKKYNINPAITTVSTTYMTPSTSRIITTRSSTKISSVGTDSSTDMGNKSNIESTLTLVSTTPFPSDTTKKSNIPLSTLYPNGSPRSIHIVTSLPSIISTSTTASTESTTKDTISAVMDLISTTTSTTVTTPTTTTARILDEMNYDVTEFINEQEEVTKEDSDNNLVIQNSTKYNYVSTTTSTPLGLLFSGQYHEVNPGQYYEVNPGQYHEVNPGQYQEDNSDQYKYDQSGKYKNLETDYSQDYEVDHVKVDFDHQDNHKTYTVEARAGDFILGEVGRIDVSNGQTLEGVRYTALDGEVSQRRISQILERFFGTQSSS